MEVVGYIARIISATDLSNRTPFIIQSVLILVAPAVMAAACYMAFGRLIIWVVPAKLQSFKQLWVPVRRLTPFFVGFDVFSFFVQAAGASMLAYAEDEPAFDSGRRIVLLGLLVQLIMLGLFCVAGVRLVLLLRGRLASESLPTDTNWQKFLKAILAAAGLILFRSIYRFIEYLLGRGNVLLTHEVYLYLLDALPIVLVTAVFIDFHPAQFLPYINIRRREPAFSRNQSRSLFPQRVRKTQQN